MDTKNMVTVFIAVTVAVLLFASLLPIFESSTISAGKEVNYSNDSTYYKLANSDDTVTLEYSSSVLTLNGETFTPSSSANVLLSDVFSLDTFLYEGNWLYRAWVSTSTSLMYPTSISLEFSNGTVTGSYTSGGTTNTVESAYTYLYYADSDGDYAQISGNAAFTIYVNDVKDINLSGLYYTGDSKTTYSYIDGTLTTYADYESSIAFTAEKIGLDLFKVTGVSVTIGEDSPFTPFRILAPTTVVGHTETTASDLVGIIPLMIVVGLVLGIVSAVVVRRME